MAEKLFTLVGTSTHKGESTYRFATGKVSTRHGVLKRNGHTDIAFQEVPAPGMTKEQGIAFLNQQGIHAKLPTSSKKPAEVVQVAPAVLTAEQQKAARNAKRKADRAAKKAAEAAATVQEPETLAEEPAQEPVQIGAEGEGDAREMERAIREYEQTHPQA